VISGDKVPVHVHRRSLFIGLLMRILPHPLDLFIYQFCLLFSGICAVFPSIPIPVRATLHVGDPVMVRIGEDAAHFGERVERSLQALIDLKMGRRHRFANPPAHDLQVEIDPTLLSEACENEDEHTELGFAWTHLGIRCFSAPWSTQPDGHLSMRTHT